MTKVQKLQQENAILSSRLKTAREKELYLLAQLYYLEKQLKGSPLENLNITPVKTLMDASGQVAGDETARLYQTLIREEYEELLDANNEVDEFDACLDLIWVVTAYMYANKWPIKDGWQEVVRSNLDKIDPETLTVLKREDGKVLKPAGWEGPKLKELVGKS